MIFAPLTKRRHTFISKKTKWKDVSVYLHRGGNRSPPSSAWWAGNPILEAQPNTAGSLARRSLPSTSASCRPGGVREPFSLLCNRGDKEEEWGGGYFCRRREHEEVITLTFLIWETFEPCYRPSSFYRKLCWIERDDNALSDTKDWFSCLNTEKESMSWDERFRHCWQVHGQVRGTYYCFSLQFESLQLAELHFTQWTSCKDSQALTLFSLLPVFCKSPVDS